jgi:mRNA-degrading endonuclease RelE of RelBE toxin-antitoxin system
MKQILILPSFERSVKKLTKEDRIQLAKGLDLFNSFLMSGNASYGFRLKKIGQDKYEFRINIKLRVIVKIEENNYYLVLVGNHDEIRRYLKDFR